MPVPDCALQIPEFDERATYFGYDDINVYELADGVAAADFSFVSDTEGQDLTTGEWTEQLRYIQFNGGDLEYVTVTNGNAATSAVGTSMRDVMIIYVQPPSYAD